MNGSLKERLRTITNSLERDESEISQAFCKMAPFIFKAVIQVAKKTNTPEEDVLSEVLFAFSAARELYLDTVYRYEGSLYKCCGADGALVLLETPKANKKRKKFWVSRSSIVVVQRAKFFNFLYVKIQQHCADILNTSHWVKRAVPEFQSSHISIDSVEGDAFQLQADLTSDPESLFSAAQMYHEIVPQISQPARSVFDLFLEGVFGADVWLAMNLRMTLNGIRAAKIEILRAYYSLERSLVQEESLQPIYMKASEL